ncbi:cell division protein FtsA [Candidatus Falkowbacteria bacterium]|jgi:cell division protein FtsA|nr:cell division protein FtsA [Candidatus Falkowbacteria bacterium]MBT4433350.1 cell division protein FtsA [Candidatus Falkowbacteria bacterium]
MKHDRLIAGLDVGSSKTRLAVARIEEKENGQRKINIIGLSEVPTEGFTKGNVSNLEDLVSTISLVVEKSEIVIGLPIEEICLGISGDHITSSISKGVVAISKANNEIEEEDVERAIESVKSMAIPPNYENLHIIPTSFNIDSQTNIKDPIGMTGIKLEAEVQVISGLNTRINNFTKSVDRTSLEIDSLVFSVLATAEAILDKKQKELGVLVLDIGHTLTKGAIFEEGEVIHAFNIPIGSSHITADLAIGLRSSIEVAEKVKRKQGTLDLSSLRRTEQVDLNKYEDNKDNSLRKNSFSKRYINEIIEARVDEIFSFVATELKKAKRFGKLPAGVVLTGGGAKLPYLTDYVKNKLSLPSSLGNLKGLSSSIDNVDDSSYSTVCGLVLWNALDQEKRKKRTFNINLNFLKNFDKLKKLLKKLTP